MLPIQSILNHGPARTKSPFSQQSGSEISSPASDLNEPMFPELEQQPFPRKKKSRDSSDLTYTRPQGPVKYPPFESLDPETYNLIQSYDIYPYGEIGQYCAHIPYSSDKKDVFEKTGRESFHVFVYKFTDPSDGRAYDVMWDYLGGFVRISPFFKSRKHKKTGPAKMLDLNKGLRDVTFHMTGGNRVAQGYWIPYQCARAVCATFCYPIAGALIPIFGPTFPNDCVRPESAFFGRMVIDERLIREASHEITAYRHASLSLTKRPTALTSYPRQGYRPLDHSHSRQRSEHDLSVNTLRGVDSRKTRSGDFTQHTRSASSLPWVDQFGVSYGHNVEDGSSLASLYPELGQNLWHQMNPSFVSTSNPQTGQAHSSPVTQKRPRTEYEPRYRLRRPAEEERQKRPRLDMEGDAQRKLTTLSCNDSQDQVRCQAMGTFCAPQPSDNSQENTKVDVQPTGGGNYATEELEAAAVLMNINAWLSGQSTGSQPIENRPRYSSV